MRRARPVFAALLLLPLGLARAAPVTVDEAMKDLEALYAKNDHAGMLQAIEDARPLVRSPDDEATLAGWQSLVFYSSHRYADAKLAMRACLELSPNAAPPQRGPPGYAREFELMRRAVRQEREAHPETAGKSEAAAELRRATRPVGPLRRAGAIIGVAGAVFSVAGAFLVVHARRDYNRLEGASWQYPLALADARDLATAGAVKQGIGISALAVGGAAIATGLIFLGAGSLEEPALAPAAAPTPGGAVLGLFGRLP